MTAKRRTTAKPPPAVSTPVESPRDADQLADAAEALFGTEEQPVILRDGRKIVIERGKVKHFGLILSFFDALVDRMSQQDVVTLVTLIEENFNGGATTALTVEDLVRQVFDRSSLVLQLLHSTVDVLPRLVESMSVLTAEEFDALDMDEGMLVAFAVFQVNWDFFSRNLPLAMKRSLPLLARKMAAR